MVRGKSTRFLSVDPGGCFSLCGPHGHQKRDERLEGVREIVFRHSQPRLRISIIRYSKTIPMNVSLASMPADLPCVFPRLRQPTPAEYRWERPAFPSPLGRYERRPRTWSQARSIEGCTKPAANRGALGASSPFPPLETTMQFSIVDVECHKDLCREVSVGSAG